MSTYCAKLHTFLSRSAVRLAVMAEQMHILKVEMDGEDGVLVTFSDGTYAGYIVEELLAQRPLREHVQVTVASRKPAVKVETSRFPVAASFAMQT